MIVWVDIRRQKEKMTSSSYDVNVGEFGANWFCSSGSSGLIALFRKIINNLTFAIQLRDICDARSQQPRRRCKQDTGDGTNLPLGTEYSSELECEHTSFALQSKKGWILLNSRRRFPFVPLPSSRVVECWRAHTHKFIHNNDNNDDDNVHRRQREERRKKCNSLAIRLDAFGLNPFHSHRYMAARVACALLNQP